MSKEIPWDENPFLLQYKDALIFYTDGIQAKPEDQNLLATLYSNRAACQMKLENFGKAYDDCSQSLRCVPNNIKCYYRMASSKLRTHKYNEALVCIDLGLNIDSNNADFLKLREFCSEMITRTTIAEQPKNYEKYLKQKGIKQQDEDLMQDMSVYKPLSIHFDDEQNTLVFPVIILYPLDNQSDCLKDCTPDTQLQDLIFTLLADGLPWDTKKRYNVKSCVVKVHDLENEEVVVLKQMKLMNLLRNYTFLHKTAAYLYIYPSNN
ncbi:Cyclophilin seven suppressor [Entamoeba marina]